MCHVRVCIYMCVYVCLCVCSCVGQTKLAALNCLATDNVFIVYKCDVAAV